MKNTLLNYIDKNNLNKINESNEYLYTKYKDNKNRYAFKIICKNIGLIYYLSYKYCFRNISTLTFDDLFSESILIVLKKLNGYDKKISKLSTYIYNVIKKHLKIFIAKNGYIINCPNKKFEKRLTPENVSINIDEIPYDNLDYFYNIIDYNKLFEKKNRLTKKQLYVFNELYINDRTQKEISKSLNISHQAIHDCKNKAIERLMSNKWK